MRHCVSGYNRYAYLLMGAQGLEVEVTLAALHVKGKILCRRGTISTHQAGVHVCFVYVFLLVGPMLVTNEGDQERFCTMNRCTGPGTIAVFRLTLSSICNQKPCAWPASLQMAMMLTG